MVGPIEKTVLAVGLNGRTRTLERLPIRVVSAELGSEAVACLRGRIAVDALVAMWDLPDMANGILICRIRSARPYLPAVTLLDSLSCQREAVARSVGVAAILPVDVDGPLLLRTVAEVLGIRAAVPGVAVESAQCNSYELNETTSSFSSSFRPGFRSDQ